MLTFPAAMGALANGWSSIDEHGCEYGATEVEVTALLQHWLVTTLQDVISMVPPKWK